MPSEPSSLRRLPVDLEEIDTCASFTRDSWDEAGQIGFVDTETGAVHTLSVAALRAAEDGDEADSLSQWERDDYAQAVTILEDATDRYERIEQWETGEEYRLMEEFAEASRNPTVRAQLLQAIAGKGAFQRFKDALTQWPAIREAWFAYRDLAHREWIRDWLNTLGIDPVDTSRHTPSAPERW